MEELVWFICYTNYMKREILDHYLQEEAKKRKEYPLKDIALLKGEMSYSIDYALYFSQVSVLDKTRVFPLIEPTASKTKTYCKGYLLTKNQVDYLRRLKGKIYNKLVKLGEKDSIPLITYTHSSKLEACFVEEKDISSVREGLEECGFEHSFIDTYLRPYLK